MQGRREEIFNECHKVDPDTKIPEGEFKGYTLLWLAARTHSFDLVSQWLQHKPNANLNGYEGRKELSNEKFRNGDLDLVDLNVSSVLSEAFSCLSAIRVDGCNFKYGFRQHCDLLMQMVNLPKRINLDVISEAVSLLNDILEHMIDTHDDDDAWKEERVLLSRLLSKMLEKCPEANFFRKDEFLKDGRSQYIFGIDVLFNDASSSNKKTYLLGNMIRGIKNDYEELERICLDDRTVLIMRRVAESLDDIFSNLSYVFFNYEELSPGHIISKDISRPIVIAYLRNFVEDFKDISEEFLISVFKRLERNEFVRVQNEARKVIACRVTQIWCPSAKRSRELTHPFGKGNVRYMHQVLQENIAAFISKPLRKGKRDEITAILSPNQLPSLSIEGIRENLKNLSVSYEDTGARSPESE